MRQTLIFDLDDTLIHCNKYFFNVLERFVSLMHAWFEGYGVTEEDIRQKQVEIDIQSVSQLGFLIDHFPQSLVSTYDYYTDKYGRAASAVEKDTLWKLGVSVFDYEAEPYPHMEETLDALAKQGHTLHLYTGGEPIIQQRKVERLALERYFGSRIYVRHHKNNEALEQILTEGQFDRAHTWMIGNSIRTDVMPALTAGIHAIHVEALSEWAYNVVPVDVQPRGAFLLLKQLREVPSAIEQYRKAAYSS
ncbi:HAD family hydrolase [Paenibacillus sp. GCM10012307]|uniref:HAD hydrolase-like protein n=1 Tax=Paenibacillus roseus TaxID=2798579 RepID=A0A934MX05_9BACL|nr:HAD hydrolase-like protein [Paenibacillus roseus]MBJ6363687.1 HAD hydrolase-like protein [Paenibacillus roseus]